MIDSTGKQHFLSLTDNHYAIVFENDKLLLKLATAVKRGDKMMNLNSELCTINSIENIFARCPMNIYTPSRKIVVNGLLCTSHIKYDIGKLCSEILAVASLYMPEVVQNIANRIVGYLDQGF